MDAFSFLLMVIAGLFALTCIVTAAVFGAWWHILMAAMFASLSGAIYNETKETT